MDTIRQDIRYAMPVSVKSQARGPVPRPGRFSSV